jgi:hypothetical protein
MEAIARAEKEERLAELEYQKKIEQKKLDGKRMVIYLSFHHSIYII